MLEGAPLDSFIALDASGPQGSRANDGRLTAREVYDLDLRARLVVLSACRSGMGRASGDGLFSLARAFFYAGAGTLVATLWDVADEPAAHLMPRFHRLVASGAHASEALRASQLALLRDLRAGRVVVQGRRGPVPLPEHPSLWAGFVAIGQP
jgi:CHAT domain-containing protein